MSNATISAKPKSLFYYWNSIIQHGRNTATYKFALARALLDLAANENSNISLESLALPYSQYLCDHVKSGAVQIRGQFEGAFIEACKNYNSGTITQEQLHEITLKHGFNCVLDAFHHVNGEILPFLFFEHHKTNGSWHLQLTDNIFNLIKENDINHLHSIIEERWQEVEARWTRTNEQSH